MALLGNTQPQATNEFDQRVKGVSLAKDAWRRLKKAVAA